MSTPKRGALRWRPFRELLLDELELRNIEFRNMEVRRNQSLSVVIRGRYADYCTLPLYDKKLMIPSRKSYQVN